MNLTANALGIAQHPMSQILEEYDDILPLQKKFKAYFGIAESDTLQMLFRLGRASKTPTTPRREVKAIVVNG